VWANNPKAVDLFCWPVVRYNNTMEKDSNTIFTIGHSTHPLDEFVGILKSFSISLLADVRNFPGSRRYPHFNKEMLESSLLKHEIRYKHFKDLGGRRKSSPGSTNTRWRNEAFRGYADYMASDAFAESVMQLQEIARHERVAYMCAEAVWWSCHRSLISDYFKVRGWKVLHIMGMGKAQEHPFTSAARIVDGELRYDEPGQSR